MGEEKRGEDEKYFATRKILTLVVVCSRIQKKRLRPTRTPAHNDRKHAMWKASLHSKMSYIPFNTLVHRQHQGVIHSCAKCFRYSTKLMGDLRKDEGSEMN
jgi:hypothetical protein